ncbi:MAG: hypothetical protein AAGG50_11130 [Bacteroidota bacterium]
MSDLRTPPRSTDAVAWAAAVLRADAAFLAAMGTDAGGEADVATRRVFAQTEGTPQGGYGFPKEMPLGARPDSQRPEVADVGYRHALVRLANRADLGRLGSRQGLTLGVAPVAVEVVIEAPDYDARTYGGPAPVVVVTEAARVATVALDGRRPGVSSPGLGVGSKSVGVCYYAADVLPGVRYDPVDCVHTLTLPFVLHLASA